MCSGRVGACQLCRVVGRGVRGVLWDSVLCARGHQQGCATGRLLTTVILSSIYLYL